ncbi:MAG: methyltransferase family protein [Promethearchaeota archaeon]
MISILESIKTELFLIDLICLYILLIGVTWSVLFPKRRIWPPPKKALWQYILTWFLFYFVFFLNALLFFLDWDSWIILSPYRFFLAIPLIILGSMLVSWGIHTLGTKNTSGIKDQFITQGPYRYTRNPQYLGDIVLFLGITIFANSLFLVITHLLLSLVFVITPWAEESWLEEQYGEPYLEYKKHTPRFL